MEEQNTQHTQVKVSIENVEASVPPHVAAKPLQNKPAKHKRPQPPFSWSHCFAYLAGALLLVATFFPWFTPHQNLIEAANQASTYAFSPLAQFLGGSSDLIVMKNHYALAEFDTLATNLKKLANNPYAVSYLAQHENTSVDSEGNQLGTPDLDNEDGKTVAYRQDAQLIPVDTGSRISPSQNENNDTLNELLGNLGGTTTSNTNATKAAQVQQNLLFSANMVSLTEYAWLFSIALLVIGIVLAAFKYHIHAPMAVLVGGSLCGLVSAGWITLCALLFVSANFAQGVSIAPLVSFVASVVILIMLTWHNQGPIPTWRANQKAMERAASLDIQQNSSHTE